VAQEHGALTYVDETHAVGVHGPRGGGLLEANGLLDRVDLVQGGLGKGYGVVGGFVTGATELIDFVRSHAPGFIFTTALPPSVAAGALASVRHLKTSGVEREALFARVASVREGLRKAGLPMLATTSQILPLLVGDSGRCEEFAGTLLVDHGIYLQPINYPTVPRGAERLRITPSPLHTDAMERALVNALTRVVGSKPVGIASAVSGHGERGLRRAVSAE
jgi:5-aminolevulinate synthase